MTVEKIVCTVCNVRVGNRLMMDDPGKGHQQNLLKRQRMLVGAENSLSSSVTVSSVVTIAPSVPGNGPPSCYEYIVCLIRGGVKTRVHHEHGRRHKRKSLEGLPMDHRPDSG